MRGLRGEKMEGKKMVDEKNNTGMRNSGYHNTGDYNSGGANSGDYNAGDFNSGERNSGFRNTGDYNSGGGNTGHINSGRWNTGHFNSGNFNTGFFNTDEPNVRMFNKETNLKRGDISFPSWFNNIRLTQWICYEDMTENEKQVYSKSDITGGHLKAYDYKEAWRKAFNEENDLNEIRATEELPNFDYQIFEEITGISKSDFDEKLGRIYTEEEEEQIFWGDLIDDE